MNIFLRFISVIGITLILSGICHIEAQACPKRFRTIKFVGRQLKKAVVAVGGGIHMGVQELKETIAEGKAEH